MASFAWTSNTKMQLVSKFYSFIIFELVAVQPWQVDHTGYVYSVNTIPKLRLVDQQQNRIVWASLPS